MIICVTAGNRTILGGFFNFVPVAAAPGSLRPLGFSRGFRERA
jgi:hypothetical protein